MMASNRPGCRMWLFVAVGVGDSGGWEPSRCDPPPGDPPAETGPGRRRSFRFDVVDVGVGDEHTDDVVLALRRLNRRFSLEISEQE